MSVRAVSAAAMVGRGVQRLRLRPGMRITVLEKGRVILLIHERPIRAYRGIARGTNPKGLRNKKDRH